MRHIVEKHEEALQDEYADGMVWLVKLFGISGIVLVALLVVHIAFTHFVSPAYDQINRDPQEVLD